MKAPSRQGKTKEMFWRKVLARFAESGLTQAGFCKQEGLNTSNLSWWKREVASRDIAVRNTRKTLRRKQYDDPKVMYWRTTIARFNSSGLSKDDFCAREGIKAQAFSWWRGELSRRDSEKRQAVALPLVTPGEMFVPLRLAEREPVQPVALVFGEVDILSGTVRIFDTATVEPLAALVRALKESVE